MGIGPKSVAVGLLIAALCLPDTYAQQPSDDKISDEAFKRLLLTSSEIVGFQSTSTGIQVLYRVKFPGIELVLCTWKTPSKPVATGCVVLPPQ